MVRRVVLWTAPRCVSCAFERSIRTLNNSKVFSEPFSNPYYFGPEKQMMRFASLPVDPDATYEATVKMLLAHYPGKDVVFPKIWHTALKTGSVMCLVEAWTSSHTHFSFKSLKNLFTPCTKNQLNCQTVMEILIQRKLGFSNCTTCIIMSGARWDTPQSSLMQMIS